MQYDGMRAGMEQTELLGTGLASGGRRSERSYSAIEVLHRAVANVAGSSLRSQETLRTQMGRVSVSSTALSSVEASITPSVALHLKKSLSIRPLQLSLHGTSHWHCSFHRQLFQSSFMLVAVISVTIRPQTSLSLNLRIHSLLVLQH